MPVGSIRDFGTQKGRAMGKQRSPFLPKNVSYKAFARRRPFGIARAGLGRGFVFGDQRLRFQSRGSNLLSASEHKDPTEPGHEVSAPPKADDEGKNVGMGAALCSQSAPHKT